MHPEEAELLARARIAGKSLGTALANGISEEVHRHLTIILLDEISNYDAASPDRLKHEFGMGMLAAFTPETLLQVQQVINGYAIRSGSSIHIKTDTPPDSEDPAQ
jgi:hypothetical protein